MLRRRKSAETSGRTRRRRRTSSQTSHAPGTFTHRNVRRLGRAGRRVFAIRDDLDVGINMEYWYFISWVRREHPNSGPDPAAKAGSGEPRGSESISGAARVILARETSPPRRRTRLSKDHLEIGDRIVARMLQFREPVRRCAERRDCRWGVATGSGRSLRASVTIGPTPPFNFVPVIGRSFRFWDHCAVSSAIFRLKLVRARAGGR
jgi:hypothetical protein